MGKIIIRVFKSWQVADERNAWVNNYELDDFAAPITSIVDPRIDDAVAAIVEAEQQIHLGGVVFWQATASTWTEDSKPYNPFAFQTYPLTVNGLRASPGEQALDSNVCLYIRKAVPTGRVGKIFYRGVLTEGDVQPGGDLSFQLATGTSIAPGGAAIAAYLTAMQPVLQGEGSGQFTLSLISTVSENVGTTFYSRAVTALEPSGVVINRRNHKYFDRQPA